MTLQRPIVVIAVMDHHPLEVEPRSSVKQRSALFRNRQDTGQNQVRLGNQLAKRKADLYQTGVEWLKLKNPMFSQMEGRGDLFYPSKRAAENTE